MDATIAASPLNGGAYDLGSYRASVKLAEPTAGAADPIDSPRGPAPFDARDKMASMLLGLGNEEQVGAARREVVEAFTKRAMMATVIRLDRVEKRANELDAQAKIEQWDAIRIEREQNDLLKSAMAGHASAHGLKQLWWAAKDPKKLVHAGAKAPASAKQATKELYLKTGAVVAAGIPKHAYAVKVAEFGKEAIVGTVAKTVAKGGLKLLGKGLALPFRGGAAAVKGVGGLAMKAVPKPIAAAGEAALSAGGSAARGAKWAVTPAGGQGLRAGGINPIVNPLSWFVPKAKRTGMFSPGRIGQRMARPVQDAAGKAVMKGGKPVQQGLAGAVKEKAREAASPLGIGLTGLTGYFGIQSARQAARPLEKVRRIG